MPLKWAAGPYQRAFGQRRPRGGSIGFCTCSSGPGSNNPPWIRTSAGRTIVTFASPDTETLDATSARPILIPSDPELDQRLPMPIPVPTEPLGLRSVPQPHSEGLGMEEDWEMSLDPFKDQPYQNMDWYEELGEASRLDTFPNSGLLSPLPWLRRREHHML